MQLLSSDACGVVHCMCRYSSPALTTRAVAGMAMTVHSRALTVHNVVYVRRPTSKAGPLKPAGLARAGSPLPAPAALCAR